VAAILPAWSAGPIGGGPGFEYSDAVWTLPGRRRPVWTEAARDAFLRSLEDFGLGPALTFVGLPDAKERADLIAYLAVARDGPGRG
jgi:cytochrome c